MKNWTLLALTAVAAGAITLGSAACSTDDSDDTTTGGGGSSSSGPKQGSTANNGSSAKSEGQVVSDALTAKVAAGSVAATAYPDGTVDTACDADTEGTAFCNAGTVAYCASDTKWYAVVCPAGQLCGQDGDTIDCYTFTTGGAGGTNGGTGGTTGAGGTEGGQGGGAQGGIIARFDDDECQLCLQGMTGTTDDGIDCSTVVAGCGANVENCEASADCIADDIETNKSSFDCAVEACQGPIATEPKANDFLVCLAAKCGTQCEATVGFVCTP